jgi:hypothetical protein
MYFPLLAGFNLIFASNIVDEIENHILRGEYCEASNLLSIDKRLNNLTCDTDHEKVSIFAFLFTIPSLYTKTYDEVRYSMTRQGFSKILEILNDEVKTNKISSHVYFCKNCNDSTDYRLKKGFINEDYRNKIISIFNTNDKSPDTLDIPTDSKTTHSDNETGIQSELLPSSDDYCLADLYKSENQIELNNGEKENNQKILQSNSKEFESSQKFRLNLESLKDIEESKSSKILYCKMNIFVNFYLDFRIAKSYFIQPEEFDLFLEIFSDKQRLILTCLNLDKLKTLSRNHKELLAVPVKMIICSGLHFICKESDFVEILDNDSDLRKELFQQIKSNSLPDLELENDEFCYEEYFIWLRNNHIDTERLFFRQILSTFGYVPPQFLTRYFYNSDEGYNNIVKDMLEFPNGIANFEKSFIEFCYYVEYVLCHRSKYSWLITEPLKIMQANAQLSKVLDPTDDLFKKFKQYVYYSLQLAMETKDLNKWLIFSEIAEFSNLKHYLMGSGEKLADFVGYIICCKRDRMVNFLQTLPLVYDNIFYAAILHKTVQICIFEDLPFFLVEIPEFKKRFDFDMNCGLFDSYLKKFLINEISCKFTNQNYYIEYLTKEIPRIEYLIMNGCLIDELKEDYFKNTANSFISECRLSCRDAIVKEIKDATIRGENNHLLKKNIVPLSNADREDLLQSIPLIKMLIKKQGIFN